MSQPVQRITAEHCVEKPADGFSFFSRLKPRKRFQGMPPVHKLNFLQLFPLIFEFWRQCHAR